MYLYTDSCVQTHRALLCICIHTWSHTRTHMYIYIYIYKHLPQRVSNRKGTCIPTYEYIRTVYDRAYIYL